MQSLRDKLFAGAALCWPNNARLVVAVSGGPDSQVLLDALARQRKVLRIAALWAVGIDHGLRADAAGELDVAEALATQHGISFERIKVAVQLQGNRLARARAARYAALEKFARDQGADGIAVAHTATDQLETILLHLARGSALRGVAGMRPRRGLLMRPLLTVTREEILAYAEAQGLPFASDPSNVDPRRARAQLRSVVLPALRLLNPQVEAHAARFAAQAQADEAILQRRAQKALQKALRPAGALALEPLQRLPQSVALRVLRTWLAHHDLKLSGAGLDRLWQARSSPRFAMSCGAATVSFERQTFWCARLRPYDEDLAIPGDMPIKDFGLTLQTSTTDIEPGAPWHEFVVPAAESVAFDADRLHFGLRIRAWQPGDRLQPLGNSGHIKIGDLFTNCKIPRALRTTWPLLVDGEKVLWVVGLRRGSGAPLSEKTRRVVTVRFDGALPWGAI